MRFRILLVCLLALLIASGGLATLVAIAQIDTSTITGPGNLTINEKGSASAQAFVLTMNAQGKATCRLATPSERSQIMQRRGDSHVIYAGAPRPGASNGKDSSPNAPPGNLPNL